MLQDEIKKAVEVILDMLRLYSEIFFVVKTVFHNGQQN